MFRIREDLQITDCDAAYVTTKTLLRASVLNRQWVAVLLETEDLEANDICKSETSTVANNTDQEGNGAYESHTFSQGNNVEGSLKSIPLLPHSPLVARHFALAEQRKKDVVLQVIVHDSFKEMMLDFFEESGDCEKQYEDGVVYVSPCAMFNLLNKDVERYQKSLLTDLKITLRQIYDFDEQKTSNYAKSVDVSPVSCSFGHLSEHDASQAIKEFFSTPRILQIDHLFSIAVDVRRKNFINAPSLLWFKVNSLEKTETSDSHLYTNACFVDERFSNLFLSNPVQSDAPLCPCGFRNSLPLATYYRNPHFQQVYNEEFLLLNNLLSIVRQKKVKCMDVTVLIDGRRGVGKGMLVRSICQKQCVHFHEENCLDLVGDSLSATEKRLDYVFELAKNSSPCALYLRNIHVLCKDKEGIQEERRTLQYLVKKVTNIPKETPVMFIGSSHASNEMSARFFSEFIYHVEINPPNETQRVSLVRSLIDQCSHSDVNAADLAKKTAGFILSDFLGVFARAQNTLNTEGKNLMMSSVTLEKSLEEIRILKAGNSDSVKIPRVTWDDVGGLQHVKDDILDTLELPLKFPNFFSNGLQRSGLLFYGPPGCGKTLLAKAIATEFSLNFYSVKGPELINMYVGQSEENVREVFKKARSMAPCIIFFDEIDSLAPNRGRSGDSGGVMDRIVSQLLAELDGMHDNTDVFVVAATNRPDLLDPSLLRPGRFDKLLYIGIPEQRDERLKILDAVTRKLKLSDEVNLEEILDICPSNLTGADFSLLASNAMMSCFRRMIKAHAQTKVKLNAEEALVRKEDFHSALIDLVPSVSLNELERYKTIKEDILNKR